MKAYKFKEQKHAESFANNCEKLMGIILGDDNHFWVVTMADFEKAIAAGYEYAK